MEEKVTKRRIMTGFLWNVAERFANQGVILLITLVLSRLLGPAQYSKLTIITIFITIADVFVQSGLSTALIQKKDEPDDGDYSSVFFMSLWVATLFYIAIFISAPFILGLFDYEELVLPLRITALILFFGAFTSVQQAIVARNMEFKKLFFSAIIASLVSGLLAIGAALLNFGIWALVIHFTVNRLVIFTVLFIKVKWRPKWIFSGRKVGKLFSFGWKVMLSSLIDAVYQNIRSLSIKKKYKEDEGALGLYNRGQQVPQTIVTGINGAISSVMLPALSRFQNDRPKMKSMVRRAIISGSFVVYPMMIGLAVMAEPLVSIILGAEWLPCVPILQIYCINYLFWPTHSANLQAINAIGKSNVYLIAEIIKKVFDIGILAATLIFFKDITFIAWGSVVSNVISAVINAWPNRKYINYGFFSQFRDILPSLMAAVAMGGIVFAMSFIPINVYVLTVVRILAGVGVYVAIAKIFKMERFTYLKETVVNLVKGRKGENK